MKDYIEFKTKISKSGGTSSSAKTTIPKEILQKMEVTVGDYITWRVYDKSNEITILFPKESSQTTKKTTQPTKKTAAAKTKKSSSEQPKKNTSKQRKEEWTQ